MRGLAEYVMRGRREALLVSVVATVVPMFFWLGAAVVGLVTLRKGPREGALVMLWALLPAAVAAWFGEIMPAATLLGLMLAAWVLRVTVSWPWALCSAASLGLLLGGGLITVGRGYLANVEQLFAELMKGIAGQATVDAPVHAMLKAPTAGDIAGMFGLILAVTVVLALIVARWWQAMLYNAGASARSSTRCASTGARCSDCCCWPSASRRSARASGSGYGCRWCRWRSPASGWCTRWSQHAASVRGWVFSMRRCCCSRR